MEGLFRVKNDPNFAAAHLEGENAVLFPSQNGLANRDLPRHGSVNDLSDCATLSPTQDSTLLEAVDAFKDGRKPRWQL